ncbi:MAG: RDD family protein [Candidatus Kerfeldbacteria bacterium]
MFCEQCGKQISEGVKFCKYCGYKAQEIKQNKQENIKYSEQKQEIDTVKYAGFWIRFFAYLIDGFINCIFLVILYILSPSFQDEYIVFIILYLFLTWGYFIYFEGKSGSTIGKKLLGLRVVTRDLEPIDYNIAFIRSLGKIPSSILFMGYIAIAFSKEKLSWHDKIAKTVVIFVKKKITKKIEKKKQLDLWIFFVFLIIMLIAGFIAVLDKENNNNQNINSKTITTNEAVQRMPLHLTIMRPLIEKDSDGANKCLRFGEKLLPDEYLSEKEIQIRGSFAGSTLTVNDKNIELNGNSFNTIIYFDFEPGENELFFEGAYLSGEKETMKCYMEYQQ